RHWSLPCHWPDDHNITRRHKSRHYFAELRHQQQLGCRR
ncbi:hypothetical protein F442_09107, partial [Phytophthora nicotianae P10297]